jgi:hypothetical protein
MLTNHNFTIFVVTHKSRVGPRFVRIPFVGEREVAGHGRGRSGGGLSTRIHFATGAVERALEVISRAQFEVGRRHAADTPGRATKRETQAIARPQIRQSRLAIIRARNLVEAPPWRTSRLTVITEGGLLSLPWRSRCEG